MITLDRYEVETTLDTRSMMSFDYIFIDFNQYVEVVKQRGTWLPGAPDPERGTLPQICSKEEVSKELIRAGRTLAVLWIPKGALRLRPGKRLPWSHLDHEYNGSCVISCNTRRADAGLPRVHRGDFRKKT